MKGSVQTRRVSECGKRHEEMDGEKKCATKRYRAMLLLDLHRLCDIALFLSEICKLVGIAARNGQKLPILTVIVVVHAAVHIALSTCGVNWGVTNGSATIQIASIVLFSIIACVTICGYTLLIVLYRHSVSTIFNKNVPTSFAKCIPSIGAHLVLLKPLEILFRYATAKFRVLPDVIVLGEVRCGTTTLCQHLTLLPGCHAPFCLWKHPELDNKETFYFVGHYLGQVSPYRYSMCFPLRITKWYHRVVLRKPFFTFDGSAQCLASPTAPYLIAQAYYAAGQPPPILVACVRDPVHQAISWWKYENNAMIWCVLSYFTSVFVACVNLRGSLTVTLCNAQFRRANNMGLSEWNTDLRSSSYPPLTLSDAINFSLSNEVEKSYRAAEELFQKLPNHTDTSLTYVLPAWAMTWPSGQLSTIGRSGSYVTNILRYERVFSELFGSNDVTNSAKVLPESKFQYVNVIPFEYLTEPSKTKRVLDCIVHQLATRCHAAEQSEELLVPPHLHRNPSAPLTPDLNLEPTFLDKQRLAKIFARDNGKLDDLCGYQFGWLGLR